MYDELLTVLIKIGPIAVVFLRFSIFENSNIRSARSVNIIISPTNFDTGMRRPGMLVRHRQDFTIVLYVGGGSA